MQQRDYILNEARKLALILARLMGLKVEGKEEDYLQYFNSTLQDEYSTELESLLNLPDAEFTDTLKKANYSSEKLNALGQCYICLPNPLKQMKTRPLSLKK
jgi:hypothetical protein